MTHVPLPIGAAMAVRDLPDHLDWLRACDRDLELQDFLDPGVLAGDWRERVTEALRLLEGWRGRLGIHGPFVGFTLAAEDPEVQDIVRRRLDCALEVCAALGADQMVVHSPLSAWDHFNRNNRPGGDARRIEAMTQALGPALRRAEAEGVTLVLENIEDVDPRARVEIVRALDSPALRVSLDTGHAQYAHGRTGAPPVDYFVAAAGDLLEHVHLQDADGHADRHWPPGEGAVPWAAVFRALARLGSRPRLLLELQDAAWIPRGAEWLVAEGLAQ